MLVTEAGTDSSLSRVWARLTEGIDQVKNSVQEIEKLHGELLLPSKPLVTQDKPSDDHPKEVDGNCEDKAKPAESPTFSPEHRRSVVFEHGDDSLIEDKEEKDTDRKLALVGSGTDSRPSFCATNNSSRSFLRAQSGLPSAGVQKTNTLKSGLWKSTDSSQDCALNDLWVLHGEVDQMELNDFLEDKLCKHVRKSMVGRISTSRFSNRQSHHSIFAKSLNFMPPTIEDTKQGVQALHPHSKLRLSWDLLSVLAVACDLLLLPMVFAFDLTENNKVGIADWITAIFWSVDIVASCITGYQRGAIVETRLGHVVKHYFLTWFILDATIVGSEWYGRAVSESVGGIVLVRATRAMRILRVLRFVRLLRLYQTLSKLEDITSSAQLVIVLSVAKMSAALMYVVHVLACGWYLIGRQDHLADDFIANSVSVGNRLQGWVFVLDEKGIDAKSLKGGYVAAVRWTLAQLNGRTDQEIRPIVEMIYTSITAAITLLFMSMFVGKLTSRMLQLQQLVDKESGYLRVLKKYTETYELSWKTMYIARRHIKDRWTSESENDTEATLLQLLPVQTGLDLLFEVRTPILNAHSFFKVLCTEFAQAVRDSLVEAVTSESARRMESIFDKGATCSRVVFIESGTLIYSRSPAVKHWLAHRDMEAQAETRRMTMHKMFRMGKKKPEDENTVEGSGLSQGRWVCEAAIWAQHWYTQGVLVSTTQSKLVSIDRDKFADTLLRHPAAHAVCNCYARGFLKKVLEHIVVENRLPSDTFTVDLEEALSLSPQGAAVAQTRSSESSTGSALRSTWSGRAGSFDDGLDAIDEAGMMPVCCARVSEQSYHMDCEDPDLCAGTADQSCKTSL